MIDDTGIRQTFFCPVHGLPRTMLLKVLLLVSKLGLNATTGLLLIQTFPGALRLLGLISFPTTGMIKTGVEESCVKWWVNYGGLQTASLGDIWSETECWRSMKTIYCREHWYGSLQGCDQWRYGYSKEVGCAETSEQEGCQNVKITIIYIGVTVDCWVKIGESDDRRNCVWVFLHFYADDDVDDIGPYMC